MLITESFKDRFSISYESGSAGSYLVIKGQESEKVRKYQIEMISSNQIEGILPLYLRQTNTLLGFYYNITSKQPLSQFLKRRKLTGNEFSAILLSIIKVLQDAKNYLLKENLFLLDDGFIYINPNTLKVSLVYVPVESDNDNIQCFKEFLVKLVMFSLDIDESGNQLLQKILINVKREGFSISELKNIVNEYSNSGSIPENSEDAPLDNSLSESGPKQFFKPLIAHIQGELKTDNQEDFKKPNLVIPESKSSKKVKAENKKHQGQENTKPQMQYKNSSLFIFTASQVIVVTILISVLKSGFLSSLGGNPATTNGAFIFILGAVDFLLIRKLLDSKNKTIVKSQKTQVTIPVENKKNINTLNSGDSKFDVQTYKERIYEKEAQPCFKDATELLGPDIKTTPLDTPDITFPYLQPEDDTSAERIIIDRPCLIIGRLKGQADYILHNSAVGKMHAEIIERDGGYYIKDLNSRNGTYVNDVRIDSNIEYEVKTQDRVNFANNRFIFYHS